MERCQATAEVRRRDDDFRIKASAQIAETIALAMTDGSGTDVDVTLPETPIEKAVGLPLSEETGVNV
jgi:hypothetical protein